MRNLLKSIIRHLKKRMYFVDELMTPLICAIGCHIANMHAIRQPFYFIKGIPDDVGLSVVIIAPPGFSKSYAFKQLFNKQYGICTCIPYKIVGKITEAGAMGSPAYNGYDGHNPGLFERYANGIICFNEISNLFVGSKAEHSQELINQVMEALTERYVNKSLRKDISFETYANIFGGIQHKRFDFSAGMGRRVLFDSMTFLQKDIYILKRARSDNRTRIDMEELREIRERLALINTQFDIQECKFDKRLKTKLENLCDNHIQQSHFEHALIGKTVIESEPSITKLHIRNSIENTNFIIYLKSMQDMVSEGSDISLLCSQLGNGQLTLKELWIMLRNFGYTYERFYELLSYAMRINAIGIEIRVDGERVYKNKLGKREIARL